MDKDRLELIHSLVLEEIHSLMDCTDEDEQKMSLLEVLTDCCMELEQYSYVDKVVIH